MKHFLSILLCVLALHTQAQIITTISGGTPGYGGDWGPATDAKIRTPIGIVKDHAGIYLVAARTDQATYYQKLIIP